MDYSTIAKQQGGSIDYSALAQNAGGSAMNGQEPETPKETFGSKVKKGIFSFLGEVKKSAVKRGEQELTAFDRAMYENQNPLSTAVQTVGAGAGFVGDVIGAGVMEVGKAILPTEAKESIKQRLATGAEAIKLPEMMESYGEWAKKHPEASANLESVINIASLFPAWGAASKTGNVAKSTAAGAVETAAKTASRTKVAAKEAVDVAQKTVKESGDNVLVSLSKPIDENLGNVIKKQNITQSDFDKYFSIAKTAKTKTGEMTPLEVAGKEQLGGALKDLNVKLKTAGKAQGDALVVNANKTVNVKSAYDNFTTKLAERLGTHFDPKGELVQVEGRISSVIGSPADERLIKSVRNSINILKRKPTLQQVNDLVDNLQSYLFKAKQIGAEPINGKTESIVKGFVADLNKAAKETGGEAYANAASEYSRLIKIRNDLNKLLGTDFKNAGSAMKQIFSPAGGNTKRVVKDIEKETGRHIFDHATVAKAVMDIVEDPRSKSLLDKIMSVPTSRKGFVDMLMSTVTERVNSPEIMKKKIYQALEEASKNTPN